MKKTTIQPDNFEKESLSEKEKEDIKIALENVKKGKVKSIEQVAKEMSIEDL